MFYVLNCSRRIHPIPSLPISLSRHFHLIEMVPSYLSIYCQLWSCTLPTRRIPSWLARLYNLNLSTRKIPSWSPRSYNLSGQEGILLAGKVGLVGHRPVSYKVNNFFQTLHIGYPIGPIRPGPKPILIWVYDLPTNLQVVCARGGGVPLSFPPEQCKRKVEFMGCPSVRPKLVMKIT
jgi:hypothetical protein